MPASLPGGDQAVEGDAVQADDASASCRGRSGMAPFVLATSLDNVGSWFSATPSANSCGVTVAVEDRRDEILEVFGKWWIGSLHDSAQ